MNVLFLFSFFSWTHWSITMKESSSSNMDLYINERKTIKAKRVIIRVSCFTTSFSEIKLLIIYTHAKYARQFLLSLIFKSAGCLYGSNISILCFFLLFCVSNHGSCRNHRLIILSLVLSWLSKNGCSHFYTVYISHQNFERYLNVLKRKSLGS